MLLLAIETSTSRSSVALLTEDGVLAAAELGRDRRHGEFVTPAIAQLLHHAGVAVGDLTHVAASVGPGLYTGLRVGLVTASTIAAAHDLPCVAVTGPDAIAHRLRHAGRTVAVALDARRREVYLGTYAPGQLGASLGVGTPAEAAAQLADDPAPLLLVGDGSEPVADELRTLAAEAGHELDLQLGGPDTAQPTAADVGHVALLALDGHDEAGTVGGPDVLQPLYLREADAKIGWDQRGRLRGGGA